MAKKLEVIELDLGVSPGDLTKKVPIAPATQQRIDQLVQHEKTEHDAIVKYKQKKQLEEKQKEEAVTKIYKALAADSPNRDFSVDELLQIAQYTDIIGLMLRLRHHIKDRGNLWKLQKGKRNGKTTYRFMPTQLKEKSTA